MVVFVKSYRWFPFLVYVVSKMCEITILQLIVEGVASPGAVKRREGGIKMKSFTTAYRKKPSRSNSLIIRFEMRSQSIDFCVLFTLNKIKKNFTFKNVLCVFQMMQNQRLH